jgi:hypothetical protein
VETPPQQTLPWLPAQLMRPCTHAKVSKGRITNTNPHIEMFFVKRKYVHIIIITSHHKNTVILLSVINELTTATASAIHRSMIRSLARSEDILLQLGSVSSQAGSIQNLLHKLIKATLHIDTGLSTGFQEQASMLACKSNPLLLRHHTLMFLQINFIPNQHLDAILVGGIPVYFF